MHRINKIKTKTDKIRKMYIFAPKEKLIEPFFLG